MSSRSVCGDETVTWWHDYYRLVLGDERRDSTTSISETLSSSSSATQDFDGSDYEVLESRQHRFDLTGFGLQFQCCSDTGRLSISGYPSKQTTDLIDMETSYPSQEEWETEIIESWEWMDKSYSDSNLSDLTWSESDDQTLPLSQRSFLWSDSEISDEEERKSISTSASEVGMNQSVISKSESKQVTKDSQSHLYRQSQSRSSTSWS